MFLLINSLLIAYSYDAIRPHLVIDSNEIALRKYKIFGKYEHENRIKFVNTAYLNKN